jgi:TetR/AcrR family transcriptional regulator, fatty acid biosynthesis regulator
MTLSRSQQKEKTRRNIINSALNQLSEDKSFASLSLREVSREAGIAPTSFYRHFKDMEELGLTLVDESGLTLRQLMRKARKRFAKGGSVILTSVETFMEFCQSNPNVFRVLFHERSGTTQALRAAVAREIQFFIVELSEFMQGLGFDKHTSVSLAEAMVAVVFNAGAETLDAKAGERDAAAKRVVSQLRYLVAGAKQHHLN